MPTIVQSAKVNPAVGGTIAFTLGGAPAAGNLLIAFCNFGLFGSARTISQASFTRYVPGCDATTNDAMDTWSRVVQGGDGTSWTFTISDASEFRSGEIYEVNGQDPLNPFNGATFVKSASSSSLNPTRIPSVLNCLALSAVCQDNSGTPSQAISGWTTDQTAISGSNRTGACAHRDAPTGDTTTAVGTTWTIGAGPTECLSLVLLVQPPQPEPPGDPSWQVQSHLNARRPRAFAPGLGR